MKYLLLTFSVLLCCCGTSEDTLPDGTLPRGKASEKMQAAAQDYLAAIQRDSLGIHSIMVLQHGKVIFEKWLGEGAPDSLHGLWSVSKTFTGTAVGFAIDEGLLHLGDKVISFFPEKLPDEISENLAAMTIKDLLTMTCGHESEAHWWENPDGWTALFLANPVPRKPGTYYLYNSLGTYMLSGIVQKLSGEKVVDYLRPRLFEPLGIGQAKWEESTEGINKGGWGLSLKTEDLAKFGLLYLHKGRWNGKQLLSKSWIEDATTFHTASAHSGLRPEMVTEEMREGDDWTQGYGYQIRISRHNSYRADGAGGQFVLVIPDADAVIVQTAWEPRVQEAIDQVWKYLYPAL